MASLFQHLFGRHGDRKSVRRLRRTKLAIEGLENRWCLSSVSYLPEFHTLLVEGDRGDNEIQVHARADEIRVVVDGRDFGAFRGVENLQIRTASGRDSVDVNVGATFPHLAIALGSGDDRLDVTVADPAVGDPAVDPPDPDLVGRIQIDAGAGDDVVEIRLPYDRFLLDIDMGPGEDVLRVIVGDRTGLGTGR